MQLEILYAAALCPPASTTPELVRRYRQNWMSNAKEIVRITGGKGIIFSSGPCASPEGLRGPQDIINLCVNLPDSYPRTKADRLQRNHLGNAGQPSERLCISYTKDGPSSST